MSLHSTETLKTLFYTVLFICITNTKLLSLEELRLLRETNLSNVSTLRDMKRKLKALQIDLKESPNACHQF